MNESACMGWFYFRAETILSDILENLKKDFKKFPFQKGQMGSIKYVPQKKTFFSLLFKKTMFFETF